MNYLVICRTHEELIECFIGIKGAPPLTNNIERFNYHSALGLVVVHSAAPSWSHLQVYILYKHEYPHSEIMCFNEWKRRKDEGLL